MFPIDVLLVKNVYLPATLAGKVDLHLLQLAEQHLQSCSLASDQLDLGVEYQRPERRIAALKTIPTNKKLHMWI